MQNFVNFIKDYYSYFVYAIEFVLAFVCAVVAFVKSRRSSDLGAENLLMGSLNSNLCNLNYDFSKQIEFFSFLPIWVKEANVLYPIHGDGQRRFEYVYQKALDLFGVQPSDHYFRLVSESVDDILKADKLQKISRDTQVVEPKKEFYEAKKDVEIEGSQDFRQDGEENQSVECSARYVSRRD